MTAQHGGDVTGIARAFGRAAETLLDFSANVNPFGPPPGVVDVLRRAATNPRILTAYPDPHARALTAFLAEREQIGAERIIVGNGGAAILDAAVRALRVRRCVLPVPAFSEYARALSAASVAVTPFPLRPESGFALDPERLVRCVRSAGAELCIFANPHNPSGALLERDRMLALVRALAAAGCTSIVDEAFIDYVPDASIARELGADEPVVVLRSLTKFYAIPGLRVGYAFASRALAAPIRSAFPSWPVGTLEQEAAVAALGDEPYAERTRSSNALERARFAAALARLDVRVFTAAANFLLADVRALDPDTERLRAWLIREHGFVVRTFPDDRILHENALIRLAVRAGEENALLVRALHQFSASSTGAEPVAPAAE
jgi:threonine-phosphate decarboxylase